MQEEEKRPPFKVEVNKQYWVTLGDKFGEYDGNYGRSYGYKVQVRDSIEVAPTEETYFASQAVQELILGSRIEEGKEFELILNSKDNKKFYTLDGKTKTQWIANLSNEDAEKPQPTQAEKTQNGVDELNALFGEENSIKTNLIKVRDNLYKVLRDIEALI